MKAFAVFVALAAALVAFAAAEEYVVPEWRGTPLVVGGQLPDYMTGHSGCVCPPAPKCAAVPCPPAPACACQSRWTVGKPRNFVARAHYEQLNQKGTPSGGGAKEFVAPEVVSRSNVGAVAGRGVIGAPPVAPPPTKGTPSGLNSPPLTRSAAVASPALPSGLVVDGSGYVNVNGIKVPQEFAAAFAQNMQGWNNVAAAAVSAPPAAAVIPAAATTTTTSAPAAAPVAAPAAARGAQPVSPPPAVIPAATIVSRTSALTTTSAPLVVSHMQANVVKPRYTVVYYRRRWRRSERKAKRLAARAGLRLRVIRALRRRVRYMRTARALFRAKQRAARRWHRFRHRALRAHYSRRVYRVNHARYVRVARRYRSYVRRMKSRMRSKAHRRLKRRLRR